MVVKNKKKKFGFSLIELLIAISVLGIVMTGTIQLMGTGSTLMARQVSSNVRLNNELRKGSIASLDILNTNNPTLAEPNSFDKFIFLKADGNSYRAFLREWSEDVLGGVPGVPIDRPLVGADGIKSLDFRIREATGPTYENYMLSIDVVAARVNNTDNTVTERHAHRNVGFSGQTVKSSDRVAVNVGGVQTYIGNAVRFAFFVQPMTVNVVKGPYHVTKYGDGLKDGTSWENADADGDGIQRGINAVSNPVRFTEVWVRGETVMTGQSYTILSTLDLKKGVKLYGGFAGDELTEVSRDNRTPKNHVTSLDAGGNHRVIVGGTGATPDDTRLDGFVITNGSSNRGGGMYNERSSPLIANCTFSGNTANASTAYDGGGGIYNWNSSMELMSCDFKGNTAKFTVGVAAPTGGGGIYNFNDDTGGAVISVINMVNCTFSGNRAEEATGVVAAQSGGGGMPNHANTGTQNITIKGCTFSGNWVNNIGTYSGGGGIFNRREGGASLDLTITEDCLFSGNWTEGTSTGSNRGGGGMYNYQTSPTIENSAFLGNRTSGSSGGNSGGGGIYNLGAIISPIIISNCVFSGNEANDTGTTMPYGVGGGVYSSSTTTANPTLKIKDSTFSGNVASTGGGGVFVAGGGTATEPNTIENSTFSGNTAKSPQATTANYGGGGMHIAGGNMAITNCTLSGNLSRNIDGNGLVGVGGGLRNSANTTITNSTFSRNMAGSSAASGGGLYTSGTTTITNSIFWGNGSTATTGTPTGREINGTAYLTNCIVTNNPTSGTYYNSTSAWLNPLANVTLVDSMIASGIVNSPDIVSVDRAGNSAGLTSVDVYIYRLNAGSHAIGQGFGPVGARSVNSKTIIVPAIDQRGVSRDVTTPDIGSFERTALDP